MAFRTSDISLFTGGTEMGGAEKVLGVVEGRTSCIGGQNLLVYALPLP